RLFPYTTLFRSDRDQLAGGRGGRGDVEVLRTEHLGEYVIVPRAVQGQAEAHGVLGLQLGDDVGVPVTDRVQRPLTLGFQAVLGHVAERADYGVDAGRGIGGDSGTERSGQDAASDGSVRGASADHIGRRQGHD